MQNRDTQAKEQVPHAPANLRTLKESDGNIHYLI